jgi:3'-5' exoribonuclease
MSDTLKELRELVEGRENKAVRRLARQVIDNPLFATWTASSHPNVHHYGTGGLLQHTYEVVTLCLANNAVFKSMGKGVSDDLIILAALYHDIGKLTDYMQDPTADHPDGWKSTDDKYKVYHITRSAIAWSLAVADIRIEGIDFSKEDEDQVLHAILAHHGRLEWKSPVTPQDRLAWILHLCDAMSARVDDCVKKPVNPHEQKK